MRTRKVTCPYCDHEGRPVRARAFPRVKNKGVVLMCRACRGPLTCMTECGHLANVLYVFATYVLASAEAGIFDKAFLDRTVEVQDLALKYLMDEFDGVQ
jgi:hypothetical protein